MRKVLILLILAIMPFASAFVVNDFHIGEPAYLEQISYIDMNITNGSSPQTLVFKLYDNGDFKNFNSTYFEANAEKSIQIEWLPTDIGTHTVDMNILEVEDGGSQLISNQIEVILETGKDIEITANDIDFNSTFTVGEATKINIFVKNNGADAEDVLVHAWHGQESLPTLIYSTSHTIQGTVGQIISFEYTPDVSGFDQIIIRIDPNNQIEETNETNNRAEKSFTASNTDSGQNIYTTTLNFRADKSNCEVVLNNNDKFFYKGIVKDANETEDSYYIDFDFVDNAGNTIFASHGYEEDEFVKPAKTVKIISVTDKIATILLIYSFNNSISYTNCETNTEELIGSLNNCQTELGNLQDSSKSCGLEKNACITSKANLETSLNGCRSDKSQCESNKSGCEVSLASLTSSTSQQVNDTKLQEQTTCNALLLEKEGQISQKGDEIFKLDIIASTGWLMFLVMIVIFVLLYSAGGIKI